jgi:hypothetical protein
MAKGLMPWSGRFIRLPRVYSISAGHLSTVFPDRRLFSGPAGAFFLV